MAEVSALTAFLLVIVFVPLFASEDFFGDGEGGHSPFPDDFHETIDPLHRIFTKKELATFDGKNDGPVYMAVNGVVFDVTSGKESYGPGQAYHKLTGKDASRAIALRSMAKENLNDDLDGLTVDQLNHLENMFTTNYMATYPVVGYLHGHEPVEETVFRRRKVEL